MSRDEREWILRWDHRQRRHYIDGPTHGEFEGITVVPKTALEAVEAERDEEFDRYQDAEHRNTANRERAEQAEAQLERVREALESCELERNAAQSTKRSDNAYLIAQRDALAGALREAAAFLDRLNLPEGPLARERFAVVRIARSALSEPLDREEG